MEFCISQSIKKRSFSGCFLVLQELGIGLSSAVHKCTEINTGYEFSCKFMRKPETKRKNVRDIGKMLKLIHPNLARLKGVFEANDHLFIISSYENGIELLQKIAESDDFTERHASAYIKDALSALEYLHENQLKHGNLKPENFICNETPDGPCVKLVDFCLYKVFDDDFPARMLKEIPSLCSPEQLLCIRTKEKSDLWMLGVMTYIMLSGYEPFYAEDQKKMFHNILANKYDLDSHHWRKTISLNAKDFIRRLLKNDVETRMSATAALHHGWIKNLAADIISLKSVVKQMKFFIADRRFQNASGTLIAIHKAMKAKNCLYLDNYVLKNSIES